MHQNCTPTSSLMFTAALWGSCLIWLHGQEGKLGEASDLLKVTEAVNGGGPVETGPEL